LGEEFETRGIFEGVDGVFFGEADGIGAFERMEIGEQRIDEGGGGGAAKEEGRFGVFDGKRFFFGESPLGAGILGFARILSNSSLGAGCSDGDLHLLQHCEYVKLEIRYGSASRTLC